MRRRKDMVMAMVSFFLVTGIIGIGVLFGMVMCKIDVEEGSGETWPEDFDRQALPSAPIKPGNPAGPMRNKGLSL
jgi:hypothetical protein